MKISFKNRPNPEHKIDGKSVWESRSVAVIGVVFAKFQKEIYVLMEKRSQTMMDEPGKWCLPCGYLDWDENGWDALIREIYEETSFYVPAYQSLLLNENKMPFYVNTEPDENRQNIALSYGLVFNFKNALPCDFLKYKDSEIDELRWVRLHDLNFLETAFNHTTRIYQAEQHFSKYLLPWWKRWIKAIFC